MTRHRWAALYFVVLVLGMSLAAGCRGVNGEQAGGDAVRTATNKTVLWRPKDVYEGKKFDSRPVDAICREKGIDFSDPCILVDKSDYTLTLLSAGVPVKQYKVLFGGNPVDAKGMEGDRCTPEGSYTVRDKYPHKQWKYFIWISYPDEQDNREFSEMKRAGLLPSSAAIGGEVDIHGPLRDEWHTSGRNWTDGCVSMFRADLEELYEHIEVGTPIVITK
jgi:murein L,D-transpeptidase YafK